MFLQGYQQPQLIKLWMNNSKTASLDDVDDVVWQLEKERLLLNLYSFSSWFEVLVVFVVAGQKQSPLTVPDPESLLFGSIFPSNFCSKSWHSNAVPMTLSSINRG